jgi:hypothetical protein
MVKVARIVTVLAAAGRLRVIFRIYTGRTVQVSIRNDDDERKTVTS